MTNPDLHPPLIHAGFLDRAVREPNTTALVDGDVSLSYGALLQRALLLSNLFHGASGASQRPIAIVGDKSNKAVEAILAALMTGRPYSFLSPSQRRPRIQRMLETLRPSLIVDVGSSEFDHVPRALVGGPVLELPIDLHEGTFDPIASPDGAAYVLFTSGSTGHPKGVVVGHRAAVVAQRAFIDKVELDVRDIVAGEAPLNFDVSVFDIFAPLSVGATLSLIPDAELNPHSLLELLEAKHVTSIFTVPTVARQLLEAGPDAVQRLTSVRRIMLTGEFIPARLATLVAPLVKHGHRVWNLYGATEFPWGLSRQLFEADLAQPNVLDQAKVDAAVVARILDGGELEVRGPGLSSGYLDEATDFDAPFLPLDHFATGDFAEEMPGKRYQFLGRRDRQIRRDGYRIELREIENWIETHPKVDVCFAAYERLENAFVAYVSMHSDSKHLVGDGTIEQYSRQVLPEYMVPNRINLLNIYPRTFSGKKDYAKLREAAAHP